MTTQKDLFNEPHITIKDNQVLENAANRLLLMIQRNPELLNGDTIGEIDRKIYAEILWEDGVQNILPSDKKEEFVKVVSKAPESDVLTRARRYLAEADLIRLPSKAIQSAERFRSRIAGSLRGK